MDNKIVDPIFKKKINRNTNILKIFNYNKNDNDSYNNYLNRDNKDNFFKMFNLWRIRYKRINKYVWYIKLCVVFIKGFPAIVIFI